MFMEQKKKKKKNNNIRRASAAGTLESFYRDGAIGASLHLQEPPWRAIYGNFYGPCSTVGT